MRDIKLDRWRRPLLTTYLVLIGSVYVLSLLGLLPFWLLQEMGAGGSLVIFIIGLVAIVSGYIIIYVGGSKSLWRPVKGIGFLLPALFGASMMTTLIFGFGMAFMNNYVPKYHVAIFTDVALCIGIVWFVSFIIRAKRKERFDAIYDLILTIMTGSLAYLLIIFFFHISRNDKALLFRTESMGAILLGVVVLFLSSGPGMLLHQIEQKHNKERNAITPVVKPVVPNVTDAPSA